MWSASLIISCEGYLLSAWLTTFDVDFDHLAETVFLYCTYFFFSFPYCSLWKKVTMHSPHLKMGSFVTQIIWNSFAWEIYLFFPIYLFIQSFVILIETHGYLFSTLVVTQYYFILLFKLFQLWPLGALSIGFWIPLTFPLSLLVWFFEHLFLVRQDAPGLSCIFPDPVLEFSHFSKESCFPSLENDIRN